MITRLWILLAFCVGSLLASVAHAQSPSVSFVEPADGATVSSPFLVKFAVTGMSVREAYDMTSNTGHHHLFINGQSLPSGKLIPYNERSLHFGGGQTETTLNLPPGQYTLTLQFGNGAHKSYGPEMSKTISITVK